MNGDELVAVTTAFPGLVVWVGPASLGVIAGVVVVWLRRRR